MLYTYTARSQTGELKTGSEEVSGEADLAHLLRTQGYILTSVKVSANNQNHVHWLSFFTKIIQPVSLFEKMIFARHLSVMVKAGVSLSQSLEALSKQTKNQRFSQILININKTVQNGGQLSDALNNYPDVFSELFVSMVRVGETSGNLEEVLNLLAIQLDKDHQLISRVRGALLYPAVIIVVMIIIGIIMMITVVPKLVATFSELKIDLPITTKAIIWTSAFLSKYTLIGVLLMLLMVSSFWRFLNTEVGKQLYNWLTLRLPFINGIVQKINTARFARTLSSLLEGGVPIIKSLQIVSKTMINTYYAAALGVSIKNIQKGQALSEILRNYPALYPPLITQMIEVGEKTGTLSNVLKDLADFYEEDINNLSKNLTTIIEPILMVVIGVAVGFFAISMIQPIYTMMTGL